MNKHRLSEIDKYLIYEAEIAPEVVTDMDAYEKFEAFLNYEGIYGFTDKIIEMVKSVGIKNL